MNISILLHHPSFFPIQEYTSGQIGNRSGILMQAILIDRSSTLLLIQHIIFNAPSLQMGRLINMPYTRFLHHISIIMFEQNNQQSFNFFIVHVILLAATYYYTPLLSLLLSSIDNKMKISNKYPMRAHMYCLSCHCFTTNAQRLLLLL